ncbi:MAG: helicase-exonuclease AddAB subunit AddB [Clostridiales bacterium]|nr:helicase-exonuclease AddAB subunit AddB [Clostridiales bacterium]
MGLRFILGRSNSGKSSFCLNEIKEKQKLDKRLIYIVPEQYSLQAERELVDVTGGIINAVVLSFRRLADNIFSEKGGIAGKTLGDTGKLMILRRILMINSDKLCYFGAVCKRQGFIERLSDEIREFAEGGFTAEDVKEISERFPKDSAMAMKLADLALIYSEYRSFLKNNYVSEDDMLTAAAEKMNESQYINGAEVWLDGFYGFTNQEFDIIKVLLSRCERVSVVLNMDVKTSYAKDIAMENSFFEPWETMQRLKKLCAENGCTVEKSVFFPESHYKSEGVARLEKEYFSWNINKSADSTGIKIFEAETTEDEVNMCAAEIIHLVRDRGLRYRDIAVTARSLSDYEEHIKLIFSHYGIPLFMNNKRNVMGHSCTELISAIVEMVADNISYESIFRCLKTELTGITRDERDILENYVLKYGIKGDTWKSGLWQWGFENDPNADREDEINRIKDKAIEPFLEFYKKYRSGNHAVRDITIDLYEILEKLDIAQQLADRAEKAEAEGNLDKAQEQIQCFEMIGELFENMVSLLGDDKVTIREYGEILDAGLSGLKMGIIPAGIDTVIIGDIERSRIPSIRALFVVGVNEGVLPSVETDSGGIFTEREKEALEENGADFIHSGTRASFEEQYLIYMGITKPKEYLYLCRNKADDTSRETRPSSVIVRLKNIFSNIKHESGNFMSLKSIDRPIPVLHRLGSGLLGGSLIWNETLNWLINSDEYRDRAVMIQRGSEQRNTNERLSQENLDRLYGDKMRTSISRLETFANCPFRYFASYSLGAKPRSVFELRTPDIGSLFHSVLQKFTETMKDRNLTWQTITEDEILKITADAVDAIAPDAASRVLLSSAAYMYLIKRIKRIAGRTVSVLRKQMTQGKFETLGSEINFGLGGELPAIEITLPDGRKMLLRGKIDRVDVYRKDGNGYIKIIDYKSGTKDFSLSDIYYGLQLQLLLYMDAFLKTGKGLVKDEPKVGGAFYFRVMDPVIKSSELKDGSPEAAMFRKFQMSGLACNEKDVLEALDESMESEGKSSIVDVKLKKDGGIGGSTVSAEHYGKLMSYAVNKAAEIGGEIIDGNVSRSPAKNSNSLSCDYCDYKAVCGFDERNGDKQRWLKHLKASEVWGNILSDNIEKNDED